MGPTPDSTDDPESSNTTMITSRYSAVRAPPPIEDEPSSAVCNLGLDEDELFASLPLFFGPGDGNDAAVLADAIDDQPQMQERSADELAFADDSFPAMRSTSFTGFLADELE